ncbi:hypothetical protein [Bacteroides graminisolvens]|uniref:lipopolysaccharide biosynthesis protein n=1 Tax=Bacteroides graminisolvens TaxID=477666 RepID=UPI0023F388ED|nr:hypothetical protein [Bacteroides graminisolvens]
MQIATKVVLNTAVLYAKILVSMAIALVSVPLVLKALGASDYGLYNLVAGVVVMLSFLNSSMTVSSQRYMSVAMGANDEQRINAVYNSSFLLHFILGVLVVFGLEIGAFFIDKLNIEPDRIGVAQIIFQFLIATTFCRIVSVPFDAIMNAHEDMVAFSVIELIDSILMLIVATTLQYITGDKLVFYCLAVLFIGVLTLLMKCGWSHWKYKSYRINLRKQKDQLPIKEMFGFAGWNLFGGLAVMGRNQGVAVMINLFLGTIANAAYGVANQINGALSNFASTFQRAINPQLMKSEGMGNRERLIRISFISSKFSVLAICLFAVPLIIEMPDVLQVWLKGNTPPYTMELSRCILMLSIVYQYSMGIMSAIQAAGKIRNYQMTIGCLILVNIPAAYCILKAGLPVYYVTIVYILIEIISLFVRIAFARKLVLMKATSFLLQVIKPTFIIVTIPLLVSLIPLFMISNLWARLIITCGLYVTVYFIMMWYIAIEKEQRDNILVKLHLKKG